MDIMEVDNIMVGMVIMEDIRVIINMDMVIKEVEVVAYN